MLVQAELDEMAHLEAELERIRTDQMQRTQALELEGMDFLQSTHMAEEKRRMREEQMRNAELMLLQQSEAQEVEANAEGAAEDGAPKELSVAEAELAELLKYQQEMKKQRKLAVLARQREFTGDPALIATLTSEEVEALEARRESSIAVLAAKAGIATPFHAVQQDDLEILEHFFQARGFESLLLAHDRRKDEGGRTLLHTAAWWGSTNCEYSMCEMFSVFPASRLFFFLSLSYALTVNPPSPSLSNNKLQAPRSSSPSVRSSTRSTRRTAGRRR
jgi:hypothetical protein